jgi:hypothetical protein
MCKRKKISQPTLSTHIQAEKAALKQKTSKKANNQRLTVTHEPKQTHLKI